MCAGCGWSTPLTGLLRWSTPLTDWAATSVADENTVTLWQQKQSVAGRGQGGRGGYNNKICYLVRNWRLSTRHKQTFDPLS